MYGPRSSGSLAFECCVFLVCLGSERLHLGLYLYCFGCSLETKAIKEGKLCATAGFCEKA